MKDRIIALLAHNTPHVKIAQIVGCTESYVSQVNGEAETPQAIAEHKRKEELTKTEKEIEDGYVRLEKKTLSQIEENLPFADFRDLALLMNSLIQKRQKNPIVGSIVHNDNRKTVVLQIPASVLPGEIVLNQNKEMIAVGEQTLAPMTTLGVKNLFHKISNQRDTMKLLESSEKVDLKDITEMPEDF